MTASAFNTLTASHELEAAGFERSQAGALAERICNATKTDRGRFATKADLYKVVLAVVLGNAAITFALLKLL